VESVLIPDWQICVLGGGLLGVLDAAAVCSVIPGFAPSGDSLFFEMRKEK
jgi:hypothetical protein